MGQRSEVRKEGSEREGGGRGEGLKGRHMKVSVESKG